MKYKENTQTGLFFFFQWEEFTDHMFESYVNGKLLSILNFCTYSVRDHAFSSTVLFKRKWRQTWTKQTNNRPQQPESPVLE